MSIDGLRRRRWWIDHLRCDEAKLQRGAHEDKPAPGIEFISRRYVSYRTKKLQMQIVDSGPCVCVRCTTSCQFGPHRTYFGPQIVP